MTQKDSVLVVLQLTGGNDALNTVIPYGNPLYYDHRQNVGISETDVLPIDSLYGLHPSMAALKPIWDAGKLAVIAGIGHEYPNYSHFRSLDIWHTAEPAKVDLDGWLGKTVRALDPKGENVLSAVNVGRGLPRALSLAGVSVASVAQLDSYGLLTYLAGVDERNSTMELFSCMYDDGLNDTGLKKPLRLAQPEDPRSRVLPYLGRTGLDAIKGADILNTVIGRYSSTVNYPSSPIGENLKAIAQMKIAGNGTRIFYTQHGSFDTHAGQLGPHAALWSEISEAVAAFFEDMRAHDTADDVVLLMFSEFGRRVADNGGGTDHGAGGVAFVMGEQVKGGMYGEFPSLKRDELEGGNLRSTNDFRATYTTLLERWLGIEPVPIVNGRFAQLAFL